MKFTLKKNSPMGQKLRGLLFVPVALMSFILLTACEPDSGNTNVNTNSAPQTHLAVGFYRADSTVHDTLSLSNSTIGLAWWGEDQDGWVTHFNYRWSTDLDEEGNEYWTETTLNSDTFIVALDRDTMLVSFEIKAVDNEGATDNSAATTHFPIFNRKPNLAWVDNSQEILWTAFEGDTSRTFGIKTFHFNSWDPDGDETIEEIVWSLDDSDTWTTLDEDANNSIHLTPEILTPGPHVLHVKARDIANAWSPQLSYPRPGDTLDTGEPIVWMVDSLAGDLLVVIDDSHPESPAEIASAALANMDVPYFPGQQFSTLMIHGPESVPYDDTELLETLEYFERVFWLSWKTTSMTTVCSSLEQYLAGDGRLFISTTDVGSLDFNDNAYVYDEICVPVDSLTDQRARVFHQGDRDHPLTPATGFENYPVMYTVQPVSFQGAGGVKFGFIPTEDADVLYYVPEDPGDPETYPEINIAARIPLATDPQKASLVYLAIPAWKLAELERLFQHLITDDLN
jgi:hypothetical protein